MFQFLQNLESDDRFKQRIVMEKKGYGNERMGINEIEVHHDGGFNDSSKFSQKSNLSNNRPSPFKSKDEQIGNFYFMKQDEGPTPGISPSNNHMNSQKNSSMSSSQNKQILSNLIKLPQGKRKNSPLHS